MNPGGHRELQEDVEARTDEGAGTALVPVPYTSPAKPNQGRASLAGLPRQLTTDELDSPGVKKLLIGMLDETGGDLEEMKAQNVELLTKLEAVTDKYIEVNNALAVAKERMKHIGSFNLLENFIVAIGGILIGAGISLNIENKQYWGTYIFLGAICFLLAAVSHYTKRE